MKKDLDPKIKLLHKLTPYSNKFSPCRIQRNELQPPLQSNHEDYFFEACVLRDKLNLAQKNTPWNRAPKDQQQPINQRNYNADQMDPNFNNDTRNQLMTEPTGQKSNSCHLLAAETAAENSEEDLTELWNKIQDGQKEKAEHPQHPHPDLYSNSSCELTEDELQKWMTEDQSSSTTSRKGNFCNQKGERHSNRNNCIYHIDICQDSNVQTEANENWGSWEDIAKQLESITISKNEDDSITQKLTLLHNKGETCTSNEEFVIIDTIDTPTTRPLQAKGQDLELAQTGKNQICSSQEINRKYGPWTYNLEIYEAYHRNSIVLIHDLPNPRDTIMYQQMSPDHRQIYEASRPLRKINWQIFQEKKPEIRALKSKRNCRMTLMQYGKDFFIFDQVKFCISPIREGTHVYFGIRAFGDFSQSGQMQRPNSSLIQTKQLKEYLYMPTNGQCLLETNYEVPECGFRESTIRKFSINLCLTKEKIAMCERFVLDENKQKREIIEVKLYDGFENREGEYLGIIESKISNFSDQWYCDTIIYIPRTKVYSGKVNEKNWEKFQIQLRLSQTGSIVAELGIFDAQSSVTNCILFGETKSSQFMMGTLLENSHQINYIMRIAGLSPIMGFAATLSRKIFVLSS